MTIPYSQTLARFSLVTLILMIFIVGAQPIAVNLFMPPLDKVVHSLTYGLILLLAYFAFPKIKLIYLCLVVLSLGALDEIHQLYLIGRSPGLDDLLADFIGILIAYSLIKVIDKFFKL
ncbi:MAG TPA: VanZ family protein [Methylotenera sp.]|nr:VanZ family protein [Methylotenera sp.]